MQTRHSREQTELDFLFQTIERNVYKNTKGCWRDFHSSRYHKGFFGVFFGKGNKTSHEGKKMNLQKDAVPTRVAWGLLLGKKATETDPYDCEQL